MFEARLINGLVLIKLVEAIKDLVVNANLDISSSGISLQAMDTSHVSLVALHMPPKLFQHFYVERNTSIGLCLQSVSKVLKCAGNNDMITLKAEEKAENLHLIFENPKQTTFSHFALRLLDLDAEHLGIPDQEYQATVHLSAIEFQGIVRDLGQIGDTVKITISKEGVRFQVDGTLGQGSLHCKPNPSENVRENVHVHCEGVVSLTFALRYLGFFIKATPMSEQVILRMSPDVPLVVEYKLGSAQDTGSLRFYLAPKIDDSAEVESQGED
jgi:proliferating cell nuclear antigen